MAFAMYTIKNENEENTERASNKKSGEFLKFFYHRKRIKKNWGKRKAEWRKIVSTQLVFGCSPGRNFELSGELPFLWEIR